MTDYDKELGRQESDLGLFKVLYQQCVSGSEDNHNLSQNSRPQG
jgi:hypothetical protein